MEKFNHLWNGPACAIIATAKEIKVFAERHVDENGHVVINVHGIHRYVKWKSLGAGLYRVYTWDIAAPPEK